MKRDLTKKQVTSVKVACEKKMSIQELSLIYQVSEDTILRAIKNLFPEKIKNGKKTYINEMEATAIKLKIEKHHNLRSTAELPKTQLEKALLVQQALIFQQEMIIEMQPKAEAFDKFMSTENLHRMDEAARLLGIGKNILYRTLQKNKIFLRQNGYNLPFQKYMDSGYFQVKETVKIIREQKVSIPVIYTTAKGMDFLRKKLPVTSK